MVCLRFIWRHTMKRVTLAVIATSLICLTGCASGNSEIGKGL